MPTDRRSIGYVPEPEEKTRQAIRRVARTPEGRELLGYLLEICGLNAIEPADLTEAQAGFTRGRRWVGMVMASHAGLTLWHSRNDRDDPNDD